MNRSSTEKISLKKLHQRLLEPAANKTGGTKENKHVEQKFRNAQVNFILAIIFKHN